MSNIYKINNDQFIAYKHYKSKRKDSPTIVFFHGFMSYMNGNKAGSIYNHCVKNDWSILIFDNLGHGNSSGSMLDQTIGGWVEAALAIINSFDSNDLVLIGSSAGAWIALLVALKKKALVKGVICIAPAPDFTELIWDSLSIEQQNKLTKSGTIELERYNIPYSLITEGKNHLLLNKKIDIHCPVHLIHGLQDEDVPYAISLTLFNKIESEAMVLKAVKNGDHRLSTEANLEIINNSITEIMSSIIHEET
jgi:pimeloyl-ACP methyl ester carboxylesterase